MSAFQEFVTALLGVSLATLKVATGLSAKAGDLIYLVRRPQQLSRAFLAINIIPAVTAIALAFWLPLEPAVKAAIVLMGITAVQPTAPGKVLGIKGRKEFACGIYVAMSLLAIVMLPAGFSVAALIFGRDERVGVGVIAEKIVAGVLLPLAIGAGIQRLAPALSARVVPWVTRVGLLLLVLGFGSILIVRWQAIVPLLGNGALLAMGVVVGLSMAGGHWLGGPAREDRATLAVASASRHPGLAFLIVAGTALATPAVDAAIMLFTAMGMLVGLGYKLWLQRALVPVAPGAAPARVLTADPESAKH
jgi:BASS family bile acid:Na+ symporter